MRKEVGFFLMRLPSRVKAMKMSDFLRECGGDVQLLLEKERRAGKLARTAARGGIGAVGALALAGGGDGGGGGGSSRTPGGAAGRTEAAGGGGGGASATTAIMLPARAPCMTSLKSAAPLLPQGARTPGAAAFSTFLPKTPAQEDGRKPRHARRNEMVYHMLLSENGSPIQAAEGAAPRCVVCRLPPPLPPPPHTTLLARPRPPFNPTPHSPSPCSLATARISLAPMPAQGLLPAALEGGGGGAAAAAAAPGPLASIQLAVGEASINLEDTSDAAMSDPAMAAAMEAALSALATQVAQIQARLAAGKAAGAGGGGGGGGGGGAAAAPPPAPQPSPFVFAEPPLRPLGSMPALPNSAVKAGAAPRMPRTVLRHAGASRTSGRV
jgi:hypothetical protein